MQNDEKDDDDGNNSNNAFSGKKKKTGFMYRAYTQGKSKHLLHIGLKHNPQCTQRESEREKEAAYSSNDENQCDAMQKRKETEKNEIEPIARVHMSMQHTYKCTDLPAFNVRCL